MENQENQQASVSTIKFNDIKNELKYLTYMVAVMMRRCEVQPSSPIMQDSESRPCTLQNEKSRIKICQLPLFRVTSRDPFNFSYLEVPQFEEEVSVGIDKKTKEKVDERER